MLCWSPIFPLAPVLVACCGCNCHQGSEWLGRAPVTSVERIGGDQPCRTFCLRCILRSSKRRKFDDIKLINGWRRNIGSVFSIKCLSSFKMIMTMCVYEIL